MKRPAKVPDQRIDPTVKPFSASLPTPPVAALATPGASIAAATAGAVATAGAPRPAGTELPLRLPDPPARARVLTIARLAQGGRWRVEAMRALSEPCLLWFTRGQGRITLGGLTRGYGAHNAVFVPAGVMHGFEVGPQTQGFAVFFGQGTCGQGASGLGTFGQGTFGLGAEACLPATAQHLRIRESGPQVELSALIDAVQRELDSPRPGSERAAQLYLGLIGVWLERQCAAQSNEAQTDDAARRLVARYAALLEREFRSGHGVAELAALLGVTPTHLTRVCRATCGRAASDLLQDRRLYEARRLLSETAAPVKEISQTLGFTSAAYFARAFHAKTGKTPSEFRKAG